MKVLYPNQLDDNDIFLKEQDSNLRNYTVGIYNPRFGHLLILQYFGERSGCRPHCAEATVLQTAEFADSLYPPIYKTKRRPLNAFKHKSRHYRFIQKPQWTLVIFLHDKMTQTLMLTVLTFIFVLITIKIHHGFPFFLFWYLYYILYIFKSQVGIG